MCSSHKYLHMQIMFLCTNTPTHMQYTHSFHTQTSGHTQAHSLVRQALILACEKLSSVPSVSMRLLLLLLLLCSN